MFLPPIILLISCFTLFFFRKFIGPLGLFYTAALSLILVLIITSYSYIIILKTGNYFFIDFGRWFYVYDYMDSNLVFVTDNLSTLTTLLVVLLTLLAQLFGIEYMYREAFILRLIYLLNLFATSVVFLFFVYDFFLILIVWECIGLFSLFLVNFYSNRIYTIKAALKTFIFSRISDFFICIAFFLFILLFNTTDFGLIFTKTPFLQFSKLYIMNFSVNLLDTIGVCILISSAVKAAQFGFHVWLPDAMEAPTPASALIHSSTLVIMGIYLIIRFSIIFEFSLVSNLLMALLGSFTIALGAIAATFQNDIKKLVAYSTVSQMGYLFCGCGFTAYNEVMFYLFAHAVNKAFLFILVGYTVHFFLGNTDLRFMGSSIFFNYDLIFFFILVSFNLTGLPITAGFLAKESLLFHTLQKGILFEIVRTLWFISFIFTPIYMLLLNVITFWYLSKNTFTLYKDTFDIYTKLWNLSKQKYSNFKTIPHQPHVLSKLTTYTLMFFLTATAFLGTNLLLSLFDVNTLNDFNTVNIWKDTFSFFFNTSIIVNIKSLYIISYFISLSLLTTLRYLYNLVN